MCLVLRLLCLCRSATLLLPLPLRILRFWVLRILGRAVALLLPRIPRRKAYTGLSYLGWCVGSIGLRGAPLSSCLRPVRVVLGVASLILRILSRLLFPLGH